MLRTGPLQPSQEQVSTLARAKGIGNVDMIVASDDKKGFLHSSTDDDFERSFKDYLQDGKSTQNIADILEPLENSNGSILIEGAPGLGKTTLMKQIAYEWANEKILVASQLVFLIPLRDPKVQEFTSVLDIVKHFCNWDDEDLSISCAKYIKKDEGKNVTLLLDGFDELPLELQKSGFFAEVIYHSHNELSCCSIIITSRPHTCVALRSQVSSQVDILGFTTDSQKQFLESALKTENLQQILAYLNDNPAVSSLCFVPFHMTVLLDLYINGVPLPKNLTELFNSFIVTSIKRHIKLANPKAEIDHVKNNIDDIPKQYKKILLQLSALCLQAIDGEQLKIVFTLEEVKKACPNIDKVGGVNCFGLLQAIEHYSKQSTVVTSLSFIHLSVQEFLAAYYITNLSPKKELQYIQANFWSDLHSNVFAMYVGLTKGQRPSFKTFLSTFGKTSALPTLFTRGKSQSGRRIANKLFEDDRKCLRLFQCFYEADDIEAKNMVVEKIYDSKMIILHKNFKPLLPNNLQCLRFFLAKSSNKQWIELNLAQCCIGDAGIFVLHQILAKTNNGISIDEIILSNNSLTAHAMQEIAEIVNSCNVKVLDLSFNSIENSPPLKNLVLATSTLQKLDLSFNKLTSDGTITFFTSLSMNELITLKVLEINSNSIDDKAVKVISQFLQENKSLDVFRIYGNLLSVDSRRQIVNSLQENDTLKEIMFDTCSEQLKHQLKSVERLINSKRNNEILIKIRFATIISNGPNPCAAKLYESGKIGK